MHTQVVYHYVPLTAMKLNTEHSNTVVILF